MKSIILSLFLVIAPLSATAGKLTITEQGDPLKVIQRDVYTLFQFDEVFMDVEKLQSLLDEIDQHMYQKPMNATLDDMGEITAGKTGVILDRQKFYTLFQQYFYSGEPANLEVPTKRVYPNVDSELLAEIHTNELGQYVTYYRESNKERSHNIKLAADAINNYVVFPGERFSFNEIVGKRTKEKGYMRAPVIVKGELAEDIGGGICQVSSTLYNVVDLAGLEIVERYSHSRSVPYVPPGRDATVSWYGPDFVFENAYNQPILIRSSSGNGKMIIKLFSSDAIKYHPREIPKLTK